MKVEQQTLFELPPPSPRATESRRSAKNGPVSASDKLRVNWGGENYALDDAALDALERECGPCEDENGVSLWFVLRQIKKGGARRVQLI